MLLRATGDRNKRSAGRAKPSPSLCVKEKAALKSERMHFSIKWLRKRASFLFGSNRRFVLTPLPTVHKRIAALFYSEAWSSLSLGREDEDGGGRGGESQITGLHLRGTMCHAEAEDHTHDQLFTQDAGGTEGWMEVQKLQTDQNASLQVLRWMLAIICMVLFIGLCFFYIYFGTIYSLQSPEETLSKYESPYETLSKRSIMKANL